MPFVTRQLGSRSGPVVASTDYMKAYAEQIRPFVPGAAATACWAPTVSAARLPQQAARALRGEPPLHRGGRLKALADDGVVPRPRWLKPLPKYGINADKINPLYA